MKINNFCFVIAVLFNILLGCNVSYANDMTTLIVMTFDDNTEYRKIGTPSIFGEYLLSQIDTMDVFSIIEYVDETNSKSKETLAKDANRASVYNKENIELDANDIALKKAIANNDFEYMLFYNEINIDQGEPTQQDEVDNNKKQPNFGRLSDLKNDSVVDLDKVKRTFVPRLKKVACKYDTRYALCGSIDYLKSGIEDHVGVGSIPSEKNPYIEVGVTAYIIDVIEEKVIWTKCFKENDKDSYIMTKYINVGTSELNSELFHGALKKVSKKLVKEIDKDLKKRKFVLRKDVKND